MDLDTGIVGLAAARLLKVPFVYQCLDPYAASLPDGWPTVIARLVQRIEDAVVSAADLFIITDLARMPQHSGASPRRVVELPNIPLSAPEPRPFSDSGLVVGYIGSLVPHRSLEAIVDTVGSLGDEHVTLQLGGFGPMEEDLRRRASEFSNVKFLGWVDDIELMKTMGAFDVFVQIEDPNHPAYRWVSPNKVFESMALGRPIVVAKGTLAADRVADTGHGVTVRFGDSGDLRQALRRLLTDPELKRRLGAAGSLAFAEAWTPAAVKARVLAAYPKFAEEIAVPIEADPLKPQRLHSTGGHR
jgi:glycosyltransferase involved in cell wall biosynthesis